VQLTFAGPLWYWRGPAPWHFVSVPDNQVAAIEAVSAAVSYGWGMIPAAVRLGSSEWTTSLWPKDGGFIVPIKRGVQHAEGLEVDDVVELTLTIAS
jgi:hypothetical protein